MAEILHWTCPYCNHDATIVQGLDYEGGGKGFTIQNPVDGDSFLQWLYIVCPNQKCRKYTLQVGLFKYNFITLKGIWEVGDLINKWNLIPPSKAKAFPDYIPKAILDDYNEACLIVDLSPKASATLSRRCLQGIIRDYWQVKHGRLVYEIEQVKDKTEAITWEAIDSVRKIGNIGAHMENDINIILDVEPNEANMLIGLIEMLLEEWYIAREERRNKLLGIKAMADNKEAERQKKSP